MFLHTGKFCREMLCHVSGEPEGSNQQFLSTHRTVVQRNDMPHLGQTWRVKLTHFSVNRIILKRNVMSPLEQAWRVKSTNFSEHRKVLQRSFMSTLEQAWKVKSTNFSTHRKVVQWNFMSPFIISHYISLRCRRCRKILYNHCWAFGDPDTEG